MSEETLPDCYARVMEYALGTLPVAAPPTAQQLEIIDKMIAAQIGNKKLTALNVGGVTPNSAAERYLKWYAYAISNPKVTWGGEYRAVLPIGPDASSKQTLGLVILAWRTNGKCVAALADDKVVTLPDSGTEEQMRSELTKTFGFKQIIDRGVAWNAQELRAVVAALRRMPVQDRGAVSGVDLVRMESANPEHPEAAHTAGTFFYNTEGTLELRMGNRAFVDDTRAFVGTDKGKFLPPSCMTVLHEVGHAVSLAGVLRGNTATGKHYDSFRLDRFAACVETCSINRMITKYAADSWIKGNVQEMFAESYAIWCLDPKFLKRFSEDLFNWFEGKSYLKDA